MTNQVASLNGNSDPSKTVLSVNSATNVKPRPLDQIVADLYRILNRYVVFPSHYQPIVIALWIVHTWLLDAFDYTPYLSVFAAAKRSGKSRVLEVLNLLCRNPRLTSGGSSAALIRTVNEANPPTILLDEIDAVYAKKNDGEGESTRQFLNAGFRRGAKFLRCAGQGAAIEAKEFPAFCAKAFAGIGRCLPDTVLDRSIPIELQRQSREQRAERFRERDARATVESVRAELEALSKDSALIQDLRSARPMLPEQLNDRAQDITEPLLAIADVAKSAWSGIARKALVQLCTQEEDADVNVKLLASIRAIFDQQASDKLTTKQIIEELIAMENGPWASMFEEVLRLGRLQTAASRLARMLNDFKIRPRTIRMGNQTPKGFHRSDFEDVWRRYLPATERAATSATSATHDRGNVAAVATVAPGAGRDRVTGGYLLALAAQTFYGSLNPPSCLCVLITLPDAL